MFQMQRTGNSKSTVLNKRRARSHEEPKAEQLQAWNCPGPGCNFLSSVFLALQALVAD